jgi:DNA invertase Pin-like site-specific DNA recombinase
MAGDRIFVACLQDVRSQKSRLLFGPLRSVMDAFAEFERALIRERQREGIALAKQRGVYRGRKRVLSDADAEVQRRVEASTFAPGSP